MGFCCEVDNIIKVVFLKKRSNKLFVANIPLYKDVTRITLNAFEVFKISRVCKLVQIYKQNIAVFFSI